MKIIVGLGNPGAQYETTRHNAGFLAIDRLVDVFQARGPARESQGEIYAGHASRARSVCSIKPQTFMNNSGKCVAPIFKFYKCAPERSDRDSRRGRIFLPLRFSVKTGGGTGGHNGLRSIDAHLGAGQTGYHRIRIGVGKPGSRAETPISTGGLGLAPFTTIELDELDPVLDDVIKTQPSSGSWSRERRSRAMNEFKRGRPETRSN